MSAARKTIRLPQTLHMHRGGELKQVQLAYESWGELNERGDNAVLIFTGLSPSAHVTSSPEDPSPGWWEEMVGPSRPIDTNRYYVICFNSLGSCFGSTGPDTCIPGTDQPYRLSFPVLTVEDIAQSAYMALPCLGIWKLHSIVGPSMGGMSALAFAMMFPGYSDNLVLISSAPRATPFAIALRSLQREIIRSDPDWHGGNYPLGEGPIMGMRLARKLGMISYRSAGEWQQRFGRERIAEERKSGDPFCIDFEVESYLEAHAAKFTGQFDPNCYLYLSRAMDLFDAAEHGGSVAAGLGRVDVKRALVMGVETDFLFPLAQQREIAEGLRRDDREVSFEALDSIQGHDSFLADMDRFRPVIADFFD
ncbi:MAG: homoserine O-acetyltransferase [Chromatiales bacterium]|nr:MAG: homoserine O-acetyltransferase [Chromatiales bacterium]